MSNSKRSCLFFVITQEILNVAGKLHMAAHFLTNSFPSLFSCAYLKAVSFVDIPDNIDSAAVKKLILNVLKTHRLYSTNVDTLAQDKK